MVSFALKDLKKMGFNFCFVLQDRCSGILNRIELVWEWSELVVYCYHRHFVAK